MPALKETGLIQRITELSEEASRGTSIEIAEIQLRGAGKSRLLRVYIDKPGGITHADCELISQKLGALLDDEDAVPGESYTLEVSSPGLDRNLSKPRDFERVLGQKIRVGVQEPIEGQRWFEGKLARLADDVLELETGPEHMVRVPISQVQKAKLKFDW